MVWFFWSLMLYLSQTSFFELSAATAQPFAVKIGFPLLICNSYSASLHIVLQESASPKDERVSSPAAAKRDVEQKEQQQEPARVKTERETAAEAASQPQNGSSSSAAAEISGVFLAALCDGLMVAQATEAAQMAAQQLAVQPPPFHSGSNLAHRATRPRPRPRTPTKANRWSFARVRCRLRLPV
jgi:hypothetical protein